MQRRIVGWGTALIGVVGMAVAAQGAPPLAGRNENSLPMVSATATPAADGNGRYRNTPQWYLHGPVTVHLQARDNVAVAQLYYSVDGQPRIAAPITPGPVVNADIRITQQGITRIRYWAVDSGGYPSVGAAFVPARGRGGVGGRGGAAAGGGGPPVLEVQAPAGATGLNLSSTAGLTAGATLMLGDGLQAEAVTLTSVGLPNSGARPARGPDVTLSAPLKNDHLAGDGFFQPYDVFEIAIDSVPPVAAWPNLHDYRVMQSDTVTPQESDPRRRTAGDNATGSGGAAIWEMEIDGRHVFPKTQDLNTLTVGKHTETVEVHDVAGNARRYTLTFQVTTSLADLNQVLSEYADNAWSTTLAASAAAGATGLQLTAPVGYRAGETLVVGSGRSEERATIAEVKSPPPPRGSADMTDLSLSRPLQQAHAAGDMVSNPRPLIAPAVVARLRALLDQVRQKQAGQKNEAGSTAGAVATLQQFDSAVPALVGDAAAQAPERAALTSAGQALIDQLQGRPQTVTGLGVTSTPGTGMIRVYRDPTPPVRNPGATYTVLVDSHVVAGNYRHETAVDVEAMIQKLGAAHHFDVDIWDPPTTAGPGRPAPPGVSLTTSPFLSLARLRRYKTIVIDSEGRDPTGTLNPVEFANFQAYIRAGGGFVALHGGDAAYQDQAWYRDLDGAPFSNHGSNAAGILADCGDCDEAELYNVDSTNPATTAFPAEIDVHEELYNTSTNPVELDLVHPLVLVDEAALIGQLNVPTPGALMNSDHHAMAWCHNFEGARSYTILLGHNWQFMLDSWYQRMVLGAIQATAGQIPANCSSYGEAAAMLQADTTSGTISADQSRALSQALEAARTDYQQAKYAAAAAALAPFVRQTASQSGAAARLHHEGMELTSWMQEYSQRPPVDWGSAHLGPSSRPLAPGGPGQ